MGTTGHAGPKTATRWQESTTGGPDPPHILFFFNTSANMDPQLHVNSISRPPVQSGRQRKTLTFTGGVRILPRLVLLAVIFAAAHYVCSAAEQETPV